MADCYSGNMSVVLAPGSKMTRMACWAHARRKVYEHHETDPKVSALPLALMNQRQYREQERRDNADTAIVQAARRRVRAQLRKGK